MSQENVEVVRDSLKALTDIGLDAYSEFWHPDINWRAIEGALDDVSRGTEGVGVTRRFYPTEARLSRGRGGQ